MEDPIPAGLYLGCNHTDSDTEDGRRATRGMKYYLGTAVEAYQSVCEAAPGKKAILNRVATPLVEEEHVAARTHVHKDRSYVAMGSSISPR